jgi:hypothetical protein
MESREFTVNVQFSKIIFLIGLFLGTISFCHAVNLTSSPILPHQNSDDQREFQNVYQQITNSQIGTTTNDNALSGYKGQYISSTTLIGASVNDTGSTQFTNINSISLSPGDWDVSGVIMTSFSGVTGTGFEAAISAFSGNTTTDQVLGDNHVQEFNGISGTTRVTLFVPTWRVSISSTTTIYLKFACTYSAGTPAGWGRISARRVR